MNAYLEYTAEALIYNYSYKYNRQELHNHTAHNILIIVLLYSHNIIITIYKIPNTNHSQSVVNWNDNGLTKLLTG